MIPPFKTVHPQMWNVVMEIIGVAFDFAVIINKCYGNIFLHNFPSLFSLKRKLDIQVFNFEHEE